MAYVMGKSQKKEIFVKSSNISTEKKINSILANDNNLYESENTKIIKSIPNLPKINIPFGSTSVKSTLCVPKITDEPGPGSYELELNKNIINAGDYTNKFFITGDNRFKSSDNHVPGVGEYDLINTSLNNNSKINLTPTKISRNKRITSHEFNSPTRIPSIPDKDSKFGFGENKEGKMEILTDPNLDKKFDGTKSNSIGPGRYNALIIKHNNALNWEKGAKKTLEQTKIEKKKEELNNYDRYKYINNLTNNSINGNNSAFYKWTNKTEGNVKNYKSKKKQLYLNDKNLITNKSTNPKIYNTKKIYKNTYRGFKDNYDISYIDLTSVPLKKKTKEITPGPGAYDPNIGNFNFLRKKNKFQNFGTYQSRKLNPIPRIKRYKNLLESNKNNYYKMKNLNKSLDDKNKLNKFVRSLHDLRINIIKDQAKKIKEEENNRLGPGAYSPDLYFNIGSHIITGNNNHNNSERKEDRELLYITINENPGVGEYDVMGQVKKEIDRILFLKKSKENKIKNDLKIKMEKARDIIRKKKENKIIIRREYKDTEEYKIRQGFLKNYYRPAFDSAEPKFKNLNSKDDYNIGVGAYNLLYPQKKMTQIKVPFLNGAKKFSNKNFDNSNKINWKVGPGTYEQRSFFDWNKKSFNVQYKLK